MVKIGEVGSSVFILCVVLGVKIRVLCDCVLCVCVRWFGVVCMCTSAFFHFFLCSFVFLDYFRGSNSRFGTNRFLSQVQV